VIVFVQWMHLGNLQLTKQTTDTIRGLESTYNTLRNLMTDCDAKMLVFVHELMRDELVTLLRKRGRACDADYIKLLNLSNKALELLND
jgi:hypothetical protein